MIGVNRISKLIELVLRTAYLVGEKPVSLALVSDRPESGKTQMIKQFDKNKKIGFVTDATAFGIWRDFKDKLENNQVNHLLFPDFLTAISRQRATVDSLITTLNPLIEEGLAELHTGFLKPLKITSPHPIGIILAMIKAPFDKNKANWEGNGFLSRLLVCSYKYSDSTVKEIFISILNGEYRGESAINIKFPDSNIEVNCSIEHGAHIVSLMNRIITKDSEIAVYGFRMLKDMRRLAMANALIDGRDYVNSNDVEMVETLCFHLNEEYREIGSL